MQAPGEQMPSRGFFCPGGRAEAIQAAAPPLRAAHHTRGGEKSGPGKWIPPSGPAAACASFPAAAPFGGYAMLIGRRTGRPVRSCSVKIREKRTFSGTANALPGFFLPRRRKAPAASPRIREAPRARTRLPGYRPSGRRAASLRPEVRIPVSRYFLL